MNKGFFRGLLLTLGLAGPSMALAEDIDLFVQPPGAVSGTPNVLILVDNTANWNTAFTNEIAALVATLNNLPVNTDGTARFRVGMMMFTETGNPNNNIDGGYVRAAIRPMTAGNKSIYMNLLNSLDRIADRSNGGKAGITYAEAYRYFDGGPPRSGNNKQKTDHTGNSSGTAASNAVYALPGNAINSRAGTPYNSPIVDGDCGGNYIVYISNGPAQDPNADIVTGTTLLSQAATAAGISGATTTIPISPSGSQNNVADEWARFMYLSPRNIVSYTVDVDKRTTGQGPGWTALLKSIANVSNGKYFDVGSGNGGAQIADALGRIFSEIQAVNSVFASVSLPVSVNTQGTYLNQVYVGMFRPDADAYPRWAGNLKQYKLGILSGSLRTLDADDQSAINPLTGFISECARSFWTPTVADNYWQFRPNGGCLAVANSQYSNYPDGNIVEKGGQGFRLRTGTVASRVTRTCTGACAGLSDFANGTAGITATLLGAANATDRTNLINWHRGQDIYDENLNGNITERRASIHGDVVHSRPVALNYGTDAAPQVVVFYGGNDGTLRAVNGNRTTAIGSVAAGGELWSFVPPEFFPQIKRLRDNTVPISFTGADVPPVRQPKPYGIDGPITADVIAGGTPTTRIYTAMRRGGRAVYAFDVSTIHTTPSSPTLLWRRGCPSADVSNDTGCSTGFEDIGQTWSEPKVLRTLGYSDPMILMGGGYDPCEDADPHTCTDSSKGKVMYLMNAVTGALLQAFDTERPVVGDIFLVPDGTSGRSKFAYAADMGGNLYRISGANANVPFGNTVPGPGAWTITRIASLGCDTVADTSPSLDCPMNRKFIFGPDVVEDPGNSGIYKLLIGSGDREKPIRDFDAALDTQNYFFMIQDVPADADWLVDGEIGLGSLTLIDSSDDPTAEDLLASKGWALELRAGEQIVTSAITVFGITTFSSHEPTLPVAGSCSSNLGTARVYNVLFQNAGSFSSGTQRDAEISGGGLPPSPVAGQVTLDNGVTVPFIIGGSATSPLESSLPTAPATGTQPRAVNYWYIEK